MPLIAQVNINEDLISLSRYASSAPSLATNLSTASLGPTQTSDPGSNFGHTRSCTNALAPPLTTQRLRPSSKRHHFRVGSGTIEPDGRVKLEFNIPKKVNDYRTESVLETVLISPDGTEIHVSRSNSPEFGSRRWNYSELPSKYWSKYNYASKFINLVRESTPKITVYTDNAVFRYLEQNSFRSKPFENGTFCPSSFRMEKIRWQ